MSLAITPQGAVLGNVVGWDEARGLLVDAPGDGLGPRIAQSIVRLDSKTIEEAVHERRAALLLFDRGDPTKPILIGLIEPVVATPLLDLAIAETEAGGEPLILEAKVNGKRVLLEAEDELELRCGEASITLRRNGRVVIRGAYVETHAEGVNRIKGGSVAIN